MRLKIAAVGRMRRGPEKDLVDDYLARFERTGRALGFSPVIVTEVEAKKPGMDAEAELLDRATSGSEPLCALDERGKTMTSPEFANLLAGWRDAGRFEPCFVIGGADGLSPGIRDKARLSLSFGPMVWPHLLVRVMLAEQLYRAAQILAGTPYHRE